MPWKLTPNHCWKFGYLHFNNNLQIQLFVLKYSPQSCTAASSLFPAALFFTPEQFKSLPLECQIHLAIGKCKLLPTSLSSLKLQLMCTQIHNTPCPKDLRSSCSTLPKEGQRLQVAFQVKAGRAASQPSGIGEFTWAKKQASSSSWWQLSLGALSLRFVTLHLHQPFQTQPGAWHAPWGHLKPQSLIQWTLSSQISAII